jgi:hypothetical protein
MLKVVAPTLGLIRSVLGLFPDLIHCGGSDDLTGQNVGVMFD